MYQAWPTQVLVRQTTNLTVKTLAAERYSQIGKPVSFHRLSHSLGSRRKCFESLLRPPGSRKPNQPKVSEE
jgi:hypothetical protein